MKNIVTIITSTLSLGVLLLSGCSTTPTHVDTGAIKAHTFSFVNGGTQTKAEFADNRDLTHIMIQQALTDYLVDKGMTKVDSGGDVTVAYLVVIGNNVTTESINKYFGYGRESGALSDKAHKAYTGTSNPNYFEAGTLLVDIIDTKSFELLSRNHVTRPLLRNVSADAREANIREAVYEVMKDLKVAP